MRPPLLLPKGLPILSRANEVSALVFWKRRILRRSCGGSLDHVGSVAAGSHCERLAFTHAMLPSREGPYECWQQIAETCLGSVRRKGRYRPNEPLLGSVGYPEYECLLVALVLH